MGMRRARIKAEGEGFYHVVSRIGGRRFLIDDAEKGILLGMIRAAAEFSGVEVYTYALMDNHFHLLVRVPRKVEISERELARRVRALYGPERSAQVFEQWAKWEAHGQGSRVAEAKARLRARMSDLSQFCKTFKETYTQDYNRRHDNTGTIWEGRFKSMLLEGSYRALMTVGGYIHLNPVRAGVAKEPEETDNTGYGAACGGDAKAKAGLEGLVTKARGGEEVAGETRWEVAKELCREVMDGELAKEEKDGMKEEEAEEKAVDAVLHVPVPEEKGEGRENGGKDGEGGTLYGLLRKRRIGFLHGGALGKASFVRGVEAGLPKRMRRRSEGVLDRCEGLGLGVVCGVREAS